MKCTSIAATALLLVGNSACAAFLHAQVVPPATGSISSTMDSIRILMIDYQTGNPLAGVRLKITGSEESYGPSGDDGFVTVVTSLTQESNLITWSVSCDRDQPCVVKQPSPPVSRDAFRQLAMRFQIEVNPRQTVVEVESDVSGTTVRLDGSPKRGLPTQFAVDAGKRYLLETLHGDEWRRDTTVEIPVNTSVARLRLLPPLDTLNLDSGLFCPAVATYPDPGAKPIAPGGASPTTTALLVGLGTASLGAGIVQFLSGGCTATDTTFTPLSNGVGREIEGVSTQFRSRCVVAPLSLGLVSSLIAGRVRSGATNRARSEYATRLAEWRWAATNDTIEADSLTAQEQRRCIARDSIHARNELIRRENVVRSEGWIEITLEGEIP